MLNSNFQENTIAWSNTEKAAKDYVLEQASRAYSQHGQLYL